VRYDYRCRRCGVIEIEHGMRDPPRTTCPRCGRRGLVKVVLAPGVVFKGPGFYATDYAKTVDKPK